MVATYVCKFDHTCHIKFDHICDIKFLLCLEQFNIVKGQAVCIISFTNIFYVCNNFMDV